MAAVTGRRLMVAAFFLTSVLMFLYQRFSQKDFLLSLGNNAVDMSLLSVGEARKADKVISYSFFSLGFTRDDPLPEKNVLNEERLLARYRQLSNAIVNWRILAPDWTVRVYIMDTHPYIDQLRKLGAQVIPMPFDHTRWAAATAWRFLAEDDESLQYWVSREAESPPTFYDSMALDEWLASGVPVHVMHLAPAHVGWNAGLWGVKRGHISRSMNNKTMQQLLDQYAAGVEAKGRRYGSQYGEDQYFMATLWTSANPKKNGICHQMGVGEGHECPFSRCMPFPLYPGPHSPAFRPQMFSPWYELLVLCHYSHVPYCRVSRVGKNGWLELYSNVTGEDFYSGNKTTSGGRKYFDLHSASIARRKKLLSCHDCCGDYATNDWICKVCLDNAQDGQYVYLQRSAVVNELTSFTVENQDVFVTTSSNSSFEARFVGPRPIALTSQYYDVDDSFRFTWDQSAVVNGDYQLDITLYNKSIVTSGGEPQVIKYRICLSGNGSRPLPTFKLTASK